MIVYLFGGVKNHDKGLLRATTLVNNTLQELGMGIKEINLGPPVGLPVYDGVPSAQAAEIMDNIRAASGVIFATTAGASGASSVLHTFLEHLEQERGILQDKNCMVLVMSETGDDGVVNDLSRYIARLGGYDSVRMLLDQSFFERGSNQEIAEKQIEDFYRMVKAKRKFYRPVSAGADYATGVTADYATGSAYDYHAGASTPNHQQAYEQAPPAPVVDENPYITNHAEFIKAGGGQAQILPPQVVNPYQPPAIDYNQQLDNKAASILQNYEALSQQDQNAGAVYTPSHMTPHPSQNHANGNGGQQAGSRAANLYSQSTPAQPMGNISPKHQDDVEEISNFFARKIQPDQPMGSAPVNNPSPMMAQQGGMEQGAVWQPSGQAQPLERAQPSEPMFAPILNPSLPNSPANQWFANETANQPKNARQLTASLVHHYQPHVAGDLQCLLQVEISGQGGFYGYLDINGQSCTYTDGRIDNPSLTVISDATNWQSVITGGMSAQKAFMTGNLKIKGNFVLLTRFDQIFNTSKNY